MKTTLFTWIFNSIHLRCSNAKVTISLTFSGWCAIWVGTIGSRFALLVALPVGEVITRDLPPTPPSRQSGGSVWVGGAAWQRPLRGLRHRKWTCGLLVLLRHLSYRVKRVKPHLQPHLSLISCTLFPLVYCNSKRVLKDLCEVNNKITAWIQSDWSESLFQSWGTNSYGVVIQI